MTDIIAAPGKFDGLHALVVEDDQDVATIIELMLERLGLQARGPVSSVKAALDALIERRPDVVVLDANLHGEPAYRVVQTLDATSIPFVVVTGFRPHTLPSAFASATVVTKPFGPERLADALAAVLRR